MSLYDNNKKDFFTRFSQKAAKYTGSVYSFVIALGIIVIWGVTGPLFGFSDTWQLVINTGTTIITFLMVFLIQNTQNRDTKAIQLKLDEIIRVTDGHNVLMDLEELSEHELDIIRRKYEDLAEKARAHIRAKEKDTDNPDILLDGDDKH